MKQDIENTIKKCKRCSLPQSEWKGRWEKPLCKVGETTYEQHILEETESKSIKEQLEEVIKKNLPEKRELKECGKCNACEMMMSCEVLYADRQFNQAISKINTSLIADEVLKVIIRKIEEIETFEPEDDFVNGGDMEYASRRLAVDNSRRWGEIKIKTDILQLLSNLSPKENKK